MRIVEVSLRAATFSAMDHFVAITFDCSRNAHKHLITRAAVVNKEMNNICVCVCQRQECEGSIAFNEREMTETRKLRLF